MIDRQLDEWAGRRSAAPALQFSGGAGEPAARRWTYGRLANQVEALSKELGAAAVPGEPVAVVMAPRGESVAALLAALRSGNPAVLLPAALPEDELTSTLAISRPGALFAPPPGQVGQWQGLRTASRRRHQERSRWSEIAIGQLTSGSTGAAKLALRDHTALRAEIAAVSERLRLQPGDRVVCVSSLAHSYGLMGGLLASLATGAELMVGASPTDLRVFTSFPPPAVSFGLAPTYAALLSAGDVDLGAPRALLSAGAPLPSGLSDAFQRRFGLTIRQDYGTTETGTIAIDADTEPSPRTVGSPLPHLAMRIRAPDGPLLGPGEDGEIQVRSVAVARGYLTPEGIEPCTDGEGWYHTRDAGAFDAAGRLIVGRRLRDPIVLPGAILHPESLEAMLARLPGIRECVVMPVQRADGTAGLRAIVASTDLGADSIRTWLGAEMPCIGGWIEIQIVDALPRSPAGKILQKYLL